MERELQEKGPTQLLLSTSGQEAGTQLGSLGVAGMPSVAVASTATLVPAVQPLGLSTSVIDLGSQPIVSQAIQGTTGKCACVRFYLCKHSVSRASIF